MDCDRCGDPIRLDDGWGIEGKTLCGPCAFEEDPEFVLSCEDEGDY